MQTQPLSLTHLIQPPTKPTAGPPPTVVLLHGVRSNEHDLMGLAPYLDERFFIISVRAPLTLGPGAFGWYEIQFTPQGMIHDPAQAERGREAVLTFLEEAVAAYGLDPKRLFLMGFSQGAITSLGVALTDPERVAGVVAMSGRLLPEIIPQIAPPKRLDGLPFFVAHGVADGVLPIQFGREIHSELTELPVALTYREYPMAHEVSPESLNDITAWLTQQLDS